MDCFYIITNKLKDKDYAITNEIRQYIEDHGKTCFLSEKDGEGHGHKLGDQQGQDHAHCVQAQFRAIRGGYGDDGVHPVDVEEVGHHEQEHPFMGKNVLGGGPQVSEGRLHQAFFRLHIMDLMHVL